MIRHIRRIISRTTHYVKSFFVGLFRHAEMTAILTLAAIGLNASLSELPFMYALPMWIEGAFVIPFASILGISILVKSAEVRSLIRA